MNGHVDSAGRALVRISLTSAATATTMEVEAWIDTGFTGELVLPQDQIVALGLPHSAVVTAELGDGSATVLEVYSCLIEWFGHVQQIEVIANTGTSPLLGVGLLQGHRLTIDYTACTLTIRVVPILIYREVLGTFRARIEALWAKSSPFLPIHKCFVPATS